MTSTNPAGQPAHTRRRDNLGSSLLRAFLFFALLPLLSISALTLWRQYQSSQAQVVEQLTSVATLKETQVNTWFNSLPVELDMLVANPSVRASIAELLVGQHNEFMLAGWREILADTLLVSQASGQKFDEVFLIDINGLVVVSTDPNHEDFSMQDERFFQDGLKHSLVQPPVYAELYDRQPIIFAATPVYDEQHTLRGVLVGAAGLKTLEEIMGERAGLGGSGETYLVGGDYRMLTTPRIPQNEAFPFVMTQGAQLAVQKKQGGNALYNNYQQPPVAVLGVYRWLPGLQAALLAEQSQAEAFAAIYQNMRLTLGLTLFTALLCTLFAILVTRRIAVPLEHLTAAAVRMASGDLDQKVSIERQDELGDLAAAFNAMARQLGELIDNLEERVSARTGELARSNQEVRQFAYIVSHDLRAPLVNLTGFATELRSDLQVIYTCYDKILPCLDEAERQRLTSALQENVPEDLKFIETSIHRIDYFLNTLIKLSRLGRRELKLEPVDCQALVTETLQSLAHQLEGGQVQVHIEPLPTINADRTSLTQIFGNILDNAVKYLDESRPGRIEISACQEADVTSFTIKDNGSGIAPHDMDKVFAPFRRAGRQDQPGEGMGLSYVQTLVRLHGGQIECQSQIDVGTSFTFTIANSLVKEGVPDG